MGPATTFCFKYLETGKVSNTLSARGFKTDNKGKFSITYDALAWRRMQASARQTKKGPECWVAVRGESRKETRQLHQEVSKAAASLGYRSTTYTNKRGKKVPVFQKNGIVIGGYSKTSYGSSAGMRFSFSREQ